MGKAFSDYLAATYLLPKLREEFGAHIELIHAYFMNMGGYYLDFSQVDFPSLEVKAGTADLVLPNQVQQTEEGTQHTNVYKPRDEVDSPGISNLAISITPELEHKAERSHCAVFHEPVDAAIVGDADGGHQTTVTSPSIINRSLMRHKYWTLTAFQLLKAQSIGLITSLPKVAAQDLEKMTSGDTTAKALAIIQISWLVLQLVTRGVVHLPSSQLEIATLAFSVSSMVTYGLLWECPRGIEYRFSVPAERTPTIDDVRSIGLLGRRYLWVQKPSDTQCTAGPHPRPIPNHAGHRMDILNSLTDNSTGVKVRHGLDQILYHVSVLNTRGLILGAVFGGSVFGGIHCLAWNFKFPTHVECLLWRICSIFTTISPIMGTYGMFRWSEYSELWRFPWAKVHLRPRRWGWATLVLFIIPYTLARLYLVIEIFRSLFYLPPNAFRNTWVGSFPQWG